MKNTVIFGLIFIHFIESCGQGVNQRGKESIATLTQSNLDTAKKDAIINPSGNTLGERVLPPPGFQRIKSDENSFANYLRQLPLKPHGSSVTLYDGNIKPNYDVYDAVVGLDIGRKDLHQCADAVMRLRAEYLWNQKQYDKIHFNLTNGFRADYAEWMKGKRIVLNGNSTFWKQTGKPSNTFNDFWKYLEFIFTYAGTLSLSKELKDINIDDLKTGDIFIQGGSPGHAVIVVDVALNTVSNKKVFLLAQSYVTSSVCS
ncbi:MAG: DUF4846 domain-containing protein [Bacteroidetes bacterium]|nr:DUF4846 domain-containing protein [Bacteroidota bacterium]